MLVSILLLFLVPIGYFIYYRELSFDRNFNFKKFHSSNTNNPSRLNETDSDKILKKRYSRLKVPKDIDTVIIGSGTSGLTTASLLAQTGKRVLVLEQHYLAGGCTHCFVDKKVEHETGIHCWFYS